MSGHLHILRSKMPGLKSCVAKDDEDDFTEILCLLIASIFVPKVARRRGFDNAMNESMVTLREIPEALKVELTDTAPVVANTSTNQ